MDNKKIFAENFNYYMDINNIDRQKLCKDLGYKYSTVRDWALGKVYPRIEKIQALADYFDITKSDLTEKKDDFITSLDKSSLLTKKIINFSKDELEEELLIKCTMLESENQKKVLDITNLYLKEQGDYKDE